LLWKIIKEIEVLGAVEQRFWFFDCAKGAFQAAIRRVILVLTAGFGDGHNTAAASVAEALRRLSPGEEVLVSDLVSEAQPLTAGVLKSLYQVAITHLPWVWSALYRTLAKSDLDPQKNAWMRPLLTRLKKQIEQRQPRVIVSTYPLYAGLLANLRQEMPVPPLVTVITDSTTVHPIWLMAPSDLYCVSDAETDEVILQMGVPPAKTRVTGFPVSLQFTEPLPEGAMQPGVQRILYLPSTPARHVAATLAALKPLLEMGVKLTLPVGKHRSRLYHVLRRFQDSIPNGALEVIGWTTRIPELLRTHEVVICKAGGAILHEVMAARTVAVIDYVVPGQEEGNADYLLSRRCALRSHTAAQTGAEVTRALAEGGKLARQMQENMLPISVPDAALRVAHEVLEIASINPS
jgi:processive 1,2-diacylglycerol beta-glucosyltransferase